MDSRYPLHVFQLFALLFSVFCAGLSACSRTTPPPAVNSPTTIHSAHVLSCAQWTLPDERLELEHIKGYVTCLNRDKQYSGILIFLNSIPQKSQAVFNAFINKHFWTDPNLRKAFITWLHTESSTNHWAPLTELVRPIDEHQLIRPMGALVANHRHVSTKRNTSLQQEIFKSVSNAENRQRWGGFLEFITQPELISSGQVSMEPYASHLPSLESYMTSVQSWLTAMSLDSEARSTAISALVKPELWNFFSSMSMEDLESVERIVQFWDRSFPDEYAGGITHFLSRLKKLARPVTCLNNQAKVESPAHAFFATLARNVGPHFQTYLAFELPAESSQTTSLCHMPESFTELVLLFQNAARAGEARAIERFTEASTQHGIRSTIIDFFISRMSQELSVTYTAAAEKKLFRRIVGAVGKRPSSSNQHLAPLFQFLFQSEVGAQFLERLGKNKELIPFLLKARGWLSSNENQLSNLWKWLPHASFPLPILHSMLQDPELDTVIEHITQIAQQPEATQFISNTRTLIEKNTFNELIQLTTMILGGTKEERKPLTLSSNVSIPAPKDTLQVQPFQVREEWQQACLRSNPLRPSLGEGRGGALIDLFACRSELKTPEQKALHRALQRLHKNNLLEPLVLPFIQAISGTRNFETFNDVLILLNQGYLDRLFTWLAELVESGQLDHILTLFQRFRDEPQQLEPALINSAQMMRSTDTWNALSTVLKTFSDPLPDHPIPSYPESPSTWHLRNTPWNSDRLLDALTQLVHRFEKQPWLKTALDQWIRSQNLARLENARSTIQQLSTLSSLDRRILWKEHPEAREEKLTLTGWDTFEILIDEGNFSLGWDQLPLEKNLTIATLLALVKSAKTPADQASSMRSMKAKLVQAGNGFTAEEKRRLTHLRSTFDFLISSAEKGWLIPVSHLLHALYENAPLIYRESKDPAVSPFGILIDSARLRFLNRLGHALWFDAQSTEERAARLLHRLSVIVVQSNSTDSAKLSLWFKQFHGDSATRTLLKTILSPMLHSLNSKPQATVDLISTPIHLIATDRIPFQNIFMLLESLKHTGALHSEIDTRFQNAISNGNPTETFYRVERFLPETVFAITSHWAHSTKIPVATDALTLLNRSLEKDRGVWDLLKAIDHSHDTIRLDDLLIESLNLRTQGVLRQQMATYLVTQPQLLSLLKALMAWRDDPDYAAASRALAHSFRNGTFQKLIADLARDTGRL